MCSLDRCEHASRIYSLQERRLYADLPEDIPGNYTSRYDTELTCVSGNILVLRRQDVCSTIRIVEQEVAPLERAVTWSIRRRHHESVSHEGLHD